MKRILAADLWPVVGVNETFRDAALTASVSAQMRLKQLVENVLLYDHVVIPTDDLVSVQILAQAFGPEGLALLIDEGLVSFVRFLGALAYVGEGYGLDVIKAQHNAFGKQLGLAWQPLGVAVREMFIQMNGVSELRAKQLATKIASVTREVDLSVVGGTVREMTYAAVQSGKLEADLAIASPDLNHLPGKAANQITLTDKLTSDLKPGDEIARLMRVARTNLELFAKNQAACDDLSTLSPVGKVLASSARGSSMGQLYEITDVPDLGAAVLTGATSLSTIADLRQTRHWQEFSLWFHETCASDPTRVAKEYVKLLKTPAKLESPFFKIVRVLIPTVVGIISAPAGVAVSAADMFLTGKLKEPSPKYFVETLEQLAPDQRHIS